MFVVVLSYFAFNLHPDKIFMGDSGSLSLGFALTTLVILFIDTNGNMLASQGWKINAPITAGIALMIVPIYDTVRIFTKRSLKGKSPLKPDKSHVHHFLLRMGYRHNQVAIILGGIKLVFIMVVLLGSYLNDHVMLPIVLVFAVVLGVWLDERAVKRVKTHSKNIPARVAAKPAKKYSPRATISERIFDHNKINMN